MFILTPEDTSFDTNLISYNQNVDLNYCVLDYSNTKDPDYKFPPMIFLEEYSKSGAELQIGKYVIQVPWDWCILLGDSEIGDLEIVDIKKFNGREFTAFSLNPISGFKPEYYPIKILNFYNEIRWTVPVVKNEHMLAVPLCGGKNPPCVFFCEPKNKLPETIDVKNLI